MTDDVFTEPTIDAHVNLASDLAVPRRFILDHAAGIHRRLAAHGAPADPDAVARRVLALYQDHDADRLVTEMDTAGIERTVLVAPDFSHVAECPLDRAGLAALHDRVRRRHPGRFAVFWGVDPRGGEDGPRLFEHCVTRYGFEGLKVYPINGYSPSDPRLYPYYRICAERGLPVLSHTGPGYQALSYEFGRPLLIDAAARDFPGVDFVLGHGGVRQVEEAAYLCAHRPNVYLDIAGFPGAMDPDGWRNHLNRLFRLGINHKILFGSDWSAYRVSYSLPSLVGAFRGESAVFDGVKPSQRRMIMGGNVRRLLAASTAAAGVQR